MIKSFHISELPAKKAPNVGTPANKMGQEIAGEKEWRVLRYLSSMTFEGGKGKEKKRKIICVISKAKKKKSPKSCTRK